MRKQKELDERMLTGEAVNQQVIRDLEDGNEFSMLILYVPIFSTSKSLTNTSIYGHKIQKIVCWIKSQGSPDLGYGSYPHPAYCIMEI